MMITMGYDNSYKSYYRKRGKKEKEKREKKEKRRGSKRDLSEVLRRRTGGKGLGEYQNVRGTTT